MFEGVYTKLLLVVISGEGVGLGRGEVKIDLCYYLTYL